MEDAVTTHPALDRALDETTLSAFLGEGIGAVSGVNCDGRARVMTVREAIAAVLVGARPLADIDSVALTHPERLDALSDQYAARMVLQALIHSARAETS